MQHNETEAHATQYLCATILQRDFDFACEVYGKYPLLSYLPQDTHERVFLDAMLKAKPHLVEQGFTPHPFGIETKYYRQQTRRIRGAVAQAASYRFCSFRFQAAWVNPLFVLVYVPDLYLHGAEAAQTVRALLETPVLQRLNIGVLDLYYRRGVPHRAITSDTGRYYSQDYGLTRVSNHPLVTLHIGNYTASKQRKAVKEIA